MGMTFRGSKTVFHGVISQHAVQLQKNPTGQDRQGLQDCSICLGELRGGEDFKTSPLINQSLKFVRMVQTRVIAFPLDLSLKVGLEAG